MSKNSRIIIIGFGSIGQRHYRNLLSLGFKDVFLYDVDTQKTRKHENTKTLERTNFNSLRQFDVVFVCSPNNLHIRQALKCAQAGCHLFIEKPLSNSLKDIDKLEQICQKKKLVNMVACNMRFHPCLSYIKKYLDSKKLGKIYSISHEFGYYLPFWRPGADYRKNYAAKKKTGGGIILDDIHEFDLLFWLNDFKEVKEARFIYGKVSNLEIETEDTCSATFKFKNNILGSVKCDYLQQKYARGCKIVGEKGNIEWDWNENIVWLYTKGTSQKLFEVKNYDLNLMYIDEVKYFLDCVKKKSETFNDIRKAQTVLKYCVNRK